MRQVHIISIRAVGLVALVVAIGAEIASGAVDTQMRRYVAMDVYAMNWCSTTLVAQRPEYVMDPLRKLYCATIRDRNVLDSLALWIAESKPSPDVMDVRLVCLMRRADSVTDTVSVGLGLVMQYNREQRVTDTGLIRSIIVRLPAMQQASYQCEYESLFKK